MLVVFHWGTHSETAEAQFSYRLERLIAVRDRLGGLHSAKIFSASVDFAESGITTIGLLGTAFTMEQEFYKSRVAAHGLTVIVPDVVQRAVIHRVIAGARS